MKISFMCRVHHWSQRIYAAALGQDTLQFSHAMDEFLAMYSGNLRTIRSLKNKNY